MGFTGTGKLMEPANVTRRPVVPGQGSDGPCISAIQLAAAVST